ncbi:cytochrome P450 [Pseudonocardia acidicola]|uniref:Cytochrome P450 n=1 Tax=Pseudonocardia acidicola TaxID=2724939 RepID=A0ABX1SCA3_9PSEU|nr:cytochrome P450 [Pseudonocardia acidicola]NMH98172.1 cytochrome P450 [Pseudonocardia acidicola]
MTEVADQQVSTFPMQRACPFSPPAEYRELRETTPIARALLPSGRHAWLVTRHADVRAMLTDPRFSSDRRHPDFPRLIKFPQPNSNFTPSLISMDPPEHGPARRAVVGEFTVKRIQELRPRIQEIVDDCIDAMLAGPRPTDLVQALSLPVPSLVICELLGVPYADHDFFQSRTRLLISRTSSAQQRQTGIDELRSYLDDLVTEKEREPADDLLSRQLLKQRETGTEDHAALVGLAFLLLLAGHETTANMISLGTVALLKNPEQLAIVTADPGKTPAAVEELLRYFTIVDTATSRLALDDVELGGVHIRAGEGVIALGNAANRDPEAFDDPDALDVERGARHHVAFGFGAHQCLGQNLARTELQIVFDTLFRRIPGLRLATTVDELPFKDDVFIYGIHALPVTW